MQQIRLLILFFFVSQFYAVQAQVNLSYYLPDETYNPEIPAPAEILGHEVGEWHVTHDKLVQYMVALAEKSDRITIRQTGKTFEGRPLLLLIITDPSNHANIENIRQQHLELTDPARSNSLQTSDMPAVVYMGFSIHGNEPSGSNASLLAAYYFAASGNPEITEALKNTVILFDPSFNPDGLQRFASWVNSRKSQILSANPENQEQNEPWPRGRTNHYWFDLNRDWLPAQLPESRARLKTFHDWKPNVLTDHHEMGTNSTFFFQPGVPSRNNPLTPARTFELTEAIGKFHAAALDSIGSLYFTKENYDDFYYGKGSTYPDINGGIGILFEQASSRGHLQESDNGLLSFPFTIRNQFNTALSTLRAVNALRVELLDHQRDFYASSMKEAPADNAYIAGSTDPWIVYNFAQLLETHKIRYEVTSGNTRINGKNYEAGETLVVPLRQPQYRLIKSIFERRTSFTDSLFYDISAWNMPMAFNMDYQSVGPKEISKFATEKDRKVELPKGEIIGGNAGYAYAFDWNNYYAPALLYQLLDKELRITVATEPFNGPDGLHFSRGTLVMAVHNQSLSAETIHSVVDKLVKQYGVTAYALNSGLDYEGKSLGSPTFESLKLPRVALLVGDGVNSYEAGEVWHLFDDRMKIPLTLLPSDRVSRSDLSRYSTIIMVDGSYGALGDRGRDQLKNWVQQGGVIIAVKDAISAVNGMGLGNFKFRSISNSDSSTQKSYADLSAERGSEELGGAIFEARIDNTHPLFYGYDRNRIAIFKNDKLFLEPSSNGFANPIIYTNNPLLSGYISNNSLSSLRGSSAIGVGSAGRGRIIALTNDLNFRAFWMGTNRIFMNAVIFGSLINSGATR